MPISIVDFLYKLNYYILNPFIVLLFAVSFVYFVYGVIKFLATEEGDKGGVRLEARNSLLWGVVGMLIMFSVYGLIRFVLATFGIPTTDLSVSFIVDKLNN